MQVRSRIQRSDGELTPTERRVSAALMADYPFAGLDTIQSLAMRTNTSPPTISRFVTKLGFNGYQDFQRQLIDEVKESKHSPIDLHRDGRVVRGTFLEDFVGRALAMIGETAAAVTDAQFQRVCDLVGDDRRGIYVIGGRISDSLAGYMSNHLRQIRANVHKLPPDPESWPEHLLQMKPKDVFLIIDFRRYQPNLLRLVEKVSAKRGVRVVLMTDKWLSPISRHAGEILTVPVESGTVWDSYTAALLLIEAILVRVAEKDWQRVSDRIRQWEDARLDWQETSDDP